MATIEVDGKGFPPSYARLNALHNLSISRLDLVRSMITVGYKNEADLTGYGWRSMGWHLSSTMLALVLTESNGGDLTVSRLFNSLDRSEKGTSSYKLGMSLSKLVAEMLLGIPWLVFVDKLFNTGALVLQAGTFERGDLAGQDMHGQWHVCEAKGRSSPPRPTLLSKAKRQAQRIVSINGNPPATASASLVHLYRTPIRVEWEDPEPKGDVAIGIKERDFHLAYYGILLELLDLGKVDALSVANHIFDVAYFDVGNERLGVGLLREIRQDVTKTRALTTRFHEALQAETRSKQFSIGMDGVLATLSPKT